MPKLLRKVIMTSNAPKPIGSYSQAVQVGDTIYVSCCIGLDPKTMHIVEGGVTEESKRVLENLKAILSAANSCFSNVVKTTVFLDDLNNFNDVDNIYKQYFVDPYPTRSCIQVVKLPKGAKVGIEVIAISGTS